MLGVWQYPSGWLVASCQCHLIYFSWAYISFVDTERKKNRWFDCKWIILGTFQAMYLKGLTRLSKLWATVEKNFPNSFDMTFGSFTGTLSTVKVELLEWFWVFVEYIFLSDYQNFSGSCAFSVNKLLLKFCLHDLIILLTLFPCRLYLLWSISSFVLRYLRR